VIEALSSGRQRPGGGGDGAGFWLGHRPGLDGLCGLAVLVVVLVHTQVPFLPGGWAGVDIFFVLSGFLITTLLLEEWDRTGSISLRHFYLRRALRLLPALVVMLGCCWLYAWAFLPPGGGRRP
jgi:peptidoglycan/LPS O-acetylase OafA/YrhL